MSRIGPFRALLVSRLREFYREPEALFWVYGFPVLLAIGLGIAFRERPPEQVRIDVLVEAQAGRAAEDLRTLQADPLFQARACHGDECAQRLRLGRTDLVVVPGAQGLEFRFDPTRPESVLARARTEDALQRAAGRADPVKVEEHPVTQPGSRYIDFLIPGLLGMNLMGGGLWGIGFVLVDMRVRKLLKRLVATPMRRSDFLLAMMGSRILFMLPEVALLLAAGALLFHVRVQGSLLAVLAVALLGAVSFAGLGLFVACRAQKIETVSGLMNVVMLPMWLLSGIFFSSERFPAALQPAIQALPLTLLNEALRAVILEGASLSSQAIRLGGLALWGAVSFVLALRWFRWS
ncbi:MAG TPA: ABC transporter permease [Candidatus Polarisedimenticolia bacterium]|jgi:ABC-type multidrug transport system permease subunit|nr:ABC transporter permease [Candidatus Polarisedimenticolia bacterium]